MRVCLLTDSDAFSGTEQHLLGLVRALPAFGVQPTIGSPDDTPLSALAKDNGISHWPVEKMAALDLKAILRVAGALRRGQFDLLHAHNGRTALIAALGCQLAGRGKLVVTQHFIAPAHTSVSGSRGFLRRRMHHWVAAHTDRIIAISEAVGAAVIGRNPTCISKVVRVWNGIHDPLIQTSGFADHATLPCAATDAFKLLCVARLEKEKGIADLIEALRRVLKQNKEVQCFIAGDGALKLTLEQRIAEEGLAESITLLGFRQDVLDLMADSDAVVLPAPAEPFGLAIVEAMALSKPVIAMASGGPLEIVEHQRSGLLVPPGDTAALASAIACVAGDADLCRRLGIAARERFMKHFTAARMAEETSKVYYQSFGAQGTVSHPQRR